LDQEEFLIFLRSPPGARSQDLGGWASWLLQVCLQLRLGGLISSLSTLWPPSRPRRPSPKAPTPPRPLFFGETIPTQPRTGSRNKRRGRKICARPPRLASPVCSPTYTLRSLAPSIPWLLGLASFPSPPPPGSGSGSGPHTQVRARLRFRDSACAFW
jgi:hypothetical protein